MTDYVNREDIDELFKEVNAIKRYLESIGVSDISELLSNYYDQSEIDVATNKLNHEVSGLQSSIGNVDESVDLQTQIVNIINLINGTLTACKVMNSIAERDALSPLFVKYCYVIETGKYYEYTGEDVLGGI